MELSLADRVLLVAVCYRTNLTLRQVALLFGISKSAAGRVVDHHGSNGIVGHPLDRLIDAGPSADLLQDFCAR